MAKKKAKQPSQIDEVPIPGPVDPQAINEELGIMRYVEKETDDEKVLFLEKVKTEQVFDARMDIMQQGLMGIWQSRRQNMFSWLLDPPLLEAYSSREQLRKV